MPTHIHTVSLETMLSETERLLVRWLLKELNAIRTELGMPEATLQALQDLWREAQRHQRETITQGGRP